MLREYIDFKRKCKGEKFLRELGPNMLTGTRSPSSHFGGEVLPPRPRPAPDSERGKAPLTGWLFFSTLVRIGTEKWDVFFIRRRGRAKSDPKTTNY